MTKVLQLDKIRNPNIIVLVGFCTWKTTVVVKDHSTFSNQNEVKNITSVVLNSINIGVPNETDNHRTKFFRTIRNCGW